MYLSSDQNVIRKNIVRQRNYRTPIEDSSVIAEKIDTGEWGELGRGRSETTSVSDQLIGETTSFSHISARK